MISIHQWQRGSLDSGAEYWARFPEEIRSFTDRLVALYKLDKSKILAESMEDLRTEIRIACEELELDEFWLDWIQSHELSLLLNQPT